MPSKRCAICQQMRQINDPNLCCQVCEEIELDLLLTTYAYIHCQTSGYTAIKEILSQIEPVRGIKVSFQLIRSWISKNWLDKNEFDSVRVPPPVRKNLEEDGFNISPSLCKLLEERKNQKPKLDPMLMKTPQKSEPQSVRQYSAMVYAEKNKKKQSP